MASAAEPVKEKKKNRLRSRFLGAQASSLDSGTPPSADGSEQRDPSQTQTSSGSSPSNCSRMRRMLFRRTRSEAVVDVPRSIGISKSMSRTNGAGESLEGQSSNGWNQRGRVTMQEELVPCHLTTPHSPPPPYDLQSDCGSVRSNCNSPPSYESVMLQDGPNDLRRQLPYCQWRQEPQIYAEPLSAYCTCRECQIRYASTEEEEHDDNCADAVFPMETHVLMQEVLADGMAFCSVM